ncbi:MAG: helix-turn-helix transcriptional regulator [Psychrobacter sp.]|nr:helix-turn-helix transcriptional regulator [Psychrobacter sp.]
MNQIIETQSANDFFNELFDFSEEDPVAVKKTAFASNFCTLIHHAGISRAELAENLDWQPSRLSKALNGSQNLTIKTMVELAIALDYDIDIHFHKNSVHRALQPWEDNLLKDLFSIIKVEVLNIQTDQKILKDINNIPKAYQTQTLYSECFNQLTTKSLISVF